MNNQTSLYARSLDELGLEAPFSESLEAPGFEAYEQQEQFDESPYAESPYAETFETAAPGAGAAGRLVVPRHPLMRSHAGTPPDLILRWNAIASGEVDIVVHFHGYSGRGRAMRIDRDKERDSGLDFADPAGSGAPGRDRPTIGVLPRGNYFGGKSGAGYNFPALVRPGVLDRLVDDALARVGAATGLSLQRGRLILTGHSGGGAPVTAILAHTDPDEVEIFDGTYGSAANVGRWAERRIAREFASPGALPPAMRILYRPGTGTQANAEAVARSLCRALAPAAASRLRSCFRVDATKVPHNDIPRTFGWRLLANAAADLPGVKTRLCPGQSASEQFGADYEDQGEDETSQYWHQPPNEHEESLREATSLYVHEQSFEDGEDLAWLDVEAPAFESGETESEGFHLEDPTHEDEESESIYTHEEEEPEALESYDEGESIYTYEDEGQSEQSTLEALLESETGSGGLADRLKGVASFVLGGDLRPGDSGPPVAALQRSLANLGHDVPVDGTFGDSTEAAVKAFQAAHGFDADGIVGLRTKAAIADALAKAALPSPPSLPLPGPIPVPLPIPVPMPAPRPPQQQQQRVSSTLADNIVRIAEQEYRRWHSPAHPKLQETEAAATPILLEYYRVGVNGKEVTAANLQSKSWQAGHPWSAVFISYVMRKAGAGSAFAYSRAHQHYIAAARRNRLQNKTGNPFWAYRVNEVAPQLGDLICRSRAGSGATYDNIDQQGWSTHCDIVTEIHPGWVRAVGGNVNQNVDAKKVRTLPDGRVATDGKQTVIFAILRCRGPIGAQAPQPIPQPPAPRPGPTPPGPAPAPSTGKLSPAKFVAAYGAWARASERKNGVPALVTLGQAALESGWGAKAGGFNFFGIKAKASDPESTRQLWRTREVCRTDKCTYPKILSKKQRPDGKWDFIVCDWFRKFPDPATAFNAHGEFLVRNKRYAKAFATSDPYAFATEVARAGYATDPSYAKVLTSVMRQIEKIGGF